MASAHRKRRYTALAAMAGLYVAGTVAAVTGFTEVNGAWQMWVEDRDSGKRWKYAVGETIDDGS